MKDIAKILELLHESYTPSCALLYHSPFQLLVATILSAQCTDERVNRVTPSLFARFPTPYDMADADLAEVERLIHSTGFFRNKAKSLVGMAKALVADHNADVPKEVDALVRLPGVARKTANVVLGTCYRIAAGVVVDTHVARISNLLGLTQHSDPVKIERDLMALLPEGEWIDFSHMVILHGRKVCAARRPDCENCTLVKICPSAHKVVKMVAAEKSLGEKKGPAKKK